MLRYSSERTRRHTNSGNKPFKVFFQYYNKAIERPIRKVSNHNINKYKGVIHSLNSANFLANVDDKKRVENVDKFIDSIFSKQSHDNIAFVGGRKGFINAISHLACRLRNDFDKLNLFPIRFINSLNNAKSVLTPFENLI